MKKTLTIFFIFCYTVSAAQLNIQFRANLKYPGLALANIGGYVDHSGNEYALVCVQNACRISIR